MDTLSWLVLSGFLVAEYATIGAEAVASVPPNGQYKLHENP